VTAACTCGMPPMAMKACGSRSAIPSTW